MKSQIQADLIEALKQRNDLKLQTLRLLANAIHNEEIAKQTTLTEAEIVTVIKREVKKRKEAAEGFKAGGRAEQSEKETAEAGILTVYLPAAMSEAEIDQIITEEIANHPGEKVGQIIGFVMKRVGSGADGATVARLVNSKLQ
ncbi:TPA: glutamyl-tRNA amidotransferase [Patescibacteria group bacterium]|nr:glutamyl-tRNA amidotransferase [Patescibacteria group bacterium]